MWWQDSKAHATCVNPENIDDVLEPALLDGAQGEAIKDSHRTTHPHPHLTAIPDELSECIVWDKILVKDLVWKGFMRERRGQGDLLHLGGVDHPAFCLTR